MNIHKYIRTTGYYGTYICVYTKINIYIYMYVYINNPGLPDIMGPISFLKYTYTNHRHQLGLERIFSAPHGLTSP